MKVVDSFGKVARYAKNAGEFFTEGFVREFKEEGSTGMALMSGLFVGLKYKGSIKNGLKAGISTKLAISTLSGIHSVMDNWMSIKFRSELVS